MKKILLLAVFVFVFTSCSTDDNSYRNPYLLDVNVQLALDLSLPQYSPLQYVSQPVYIPNQGNRGIIIIKSGPNSYRAFDASDPNHVPNACSTLSIDGIQGVCGCEDGNTYDFLTGLPTTEGLEYPLMEYAVILNGNTLVVSH